MWTGGHLALSPMQVPMPSGVTAQVQQSSGQWIAAQGSALQVFVCGTHVLPAPHWGVGQRVVRQLPSLVMGSMFIALQNCDGSQATCAQGSGWQLPATQRSSAPHLPGTQRSLQLPSSQYWPTGQLLFMHLSSWQRPATQICGAGQASGGALQSRQRASVPLATQILGDGHTTLAQTSTHMPVFSSHFSPL